eukprot:Nk52_evm1s1594 gene=Nk52_evmTU1s1594
MSWDGIEDDVKNVIERCHQCHTGNIAQPGFKLPMKLHDDADTEVMEVIYIDFHDALPTNRQNYTTCLRIVDQRNAFVQNLGILQHFSIPYISKGH